MFLSHTNGCALDISERPFFINVILRWPSRHEASTTEADPDRFGRVEQADARPRNSAAREMDLSSSYLEDGSKHGLNPTLRPLSCKRQHILYLNLYSHGPSIHERRLPPHSSREMVNKRTKKHRPGEDARRRLFIGNPAATHRRNERVPIIKHILSSGVSLRLLLLCFYCFVLETFRSIV